MDDDTLPPRVDVGGGTSVRIIPERLVQVEPRRPSQESPAPPFPQRDKDDG